MPKKLYCVTVNGKQSTWSIDTYAKPEWVTDWRADGLEVIEPLNVTPSWVPELFGTPGVRAWCFLQDLWNFKNPWSQR